MDDLDVVVLSCFFIGIIIFLISFYLGLYIYVYPNGFDINTFFNILVKVSQQNIWISVFIVIGIIMAITPVIYAVYRVVESLQN